MELAYRKAVKDDADLLIDIYNASFYDDYVRYGMCPAYEKTKEEIESSIEDSISLSKKLSKSWAFCCIYGIMNTKWVGSLDFS